jgi:acetyl-CoA synthetase
MSVGRARDNYARMHAAFAWQVPQEFNIAQACCGRWAQRPDATQRVAIRAHGASAGSQFLTYRQLQL